MVDKYQISTGKTDKQTLVELVEKVNEIVEVVSARAGHPQRQLPGPLEHIQFIETMLQRVQSGPVTFLVQTGQSSDATLSLQQAIVASQKALQLLKTELVIAQ